ncbi:MAG: glycosyltransferase family 39 protein [Bacteroidales bacterium]|nr:glycosyltransferase family 39 protein [Bacteroidales bacterium]
MKRDLSIYGLLILVGAVLFIPLTGRVHLFDWDEINFAESAREMIVSGDYLNVQIFYKPFWEKPPLFIWFQVISMKLFGVNEFAARFPNAICGIVTLLILFYFGKKIKDEKFGLIWSATYLCSLLPFFYFKSGIIDPWFNLFIFLAVLQWLNAMNKLAPGFKYRPIMLSGFFLGLAVLTKGPAAVLIFGLTIGILLVFNKFKFQMKVAHILGFTGVLILTGGFWFILQLLSGNGEVIVDFIVYQIRLFREKDAGHGGFPLYHFVILFFGVFPASIFAIHGHKKFTNDNDAFLLIRRTMIILFWVVLILFSIVNTKIVHYSSMCYFPMTFLAAYSIYHIINKWAHYKTWMGVTLVISGVLPAIAVAALPIFDRYKSWFIEKDLIKHSFTAGNIQANPGWSGFESIIGLVLIMGIILSLIFFKREKNIASLIVLGSSCVLFTTLTMLFITPGVEKYSQNAAIEFLKEKSGEDAYIHTYYKSYAVLFYTNAQPPQNPIVYNGHWLGLGDIDKKAYFVIRNDKKEHILNMYPEIKEMYEKNGYVFCVRYPKQNKEEITLDDQQ